MENNKVQMEIFIKTMKAETKTVTKRGLEEGTTNTAGTIDLNYDPIEGAIRTKLEKNKCHEDKTPSLESILQEVNKVTRVVIDNLSQSLNIMNVSKLEIEFGVALKENLKLYIFEAGGEQSIKFKITLEK